MKKGLQKMVKDPDIAGKSTATDNDKSARFIL
jgi:hypothetical protein